MSNLPVPEAVEPKALDIQHDTDPAQDHGPAKRIPHIGHAILFFSLAYFLVNLCGLAIFSIAHIHLDAVAQHPGIALAVQALAYILTLSLSAWFFPHLWELLFPARHPLELPGRCAAAGTGLSSAESCSALQRKPRCTSSPSPRQPRSTPS